MKSKLVLKLKRVIKKYCGKDGAIAPATLSYLIKFATLKSFTIFFSLSCRSPYLEHVIDVTIALEALD